MSAQLDFDARRKPAQPPARSFRYEEGGFSEIVLRGDRLQQVIGQPLGQGADRCRIAAEEPRSEGIDYIERQVHSFVILWPERAQSSATLAQASI
jgi:hypothetical protein